MQRNKSIINPFNNKIWIFDEYQQPSINKGSIIMYIILTIDLMDYLKIYVYKIDIFYNKLQKGVYMVQSNFVAYIRKSL